MAKRTKKLEVVLREPHAKQAEFLDSKAKRKVIKAGRRGGKTTGIAIYAVVEFLAGRRVLYATPTADQIQTFWHEVVTALAPLIEAGIFVKNETNHTITVPNTKQRIRAKTAYNADTLRGDYADVLIMDEFQLIDRDAWESVGAPMLLDNDGDAVFIYTPPRPHDKARGYRHARDLFVMACKPENHEWKAFHFTSMDNPHISKVALERMARDMTAESYRREIEAEDTDESAGALWTRKMIEDTRVERLPETLNRIAVGIDPAGGDTENGIVSVASAGNHVYIFADASIKAGPNFWGADAVALAIKTDADIICGETNYGGDMVEDIIKPKIRDMNCKARYRNVRATRGKAVRAEPLVAKFERGEAHIVGRLPQLEDEMCIWIPNSNMNSPNRIDAMVWAHAAVEQNAPAMVM